MEGGDSCCYPLVPGAAESGPVCLGRCPAGWQGVQQFGDLVQGEPDALGCGDEREASEDVPGVSALVAGAAGGPDQAAVFVVAKRRGAQSCPAGGLPDGQLR